MDFGEFPRFFARVINAPHCADAPNAIFRGPSWRYIFLTALYFALEAAGSIYQEVAHCLQFCRTEQSVGGYFAEFERLLRKAASATRMGTSFPEACISFLFMQNAALSRREQSPSLASTQRSLAFPDVAMTMRRLSGHRGGAARQDLLAPEDAY